MHEDTHAAAAALAPVAPRARVLCLGNELLADDALGRLVADALLSSPHPGLEVVFSDEAGLRLLDDLIGVPVLVVVDAVQTGKAPPGTLHIFRGSDIVAAAAGTSQHSLNLFEALELARTLGLDVPGLVVVMAVEAEDCLTVGGAPTPAVRSAVPRVLGAVEAFLRPWL